MFPPTKDFFGPFVIGSESLVFDAWAVAPVGQCWVGRVGPQWSVS